MKEKLLNILRRLPLKVYLILAAVIIFTFFSNNLDLVDVQKTAIVIAAGIDKREEEYTLTAQIALPSGDKNTAGTSPIEVHGSGKTVSECISQLYSRTGRVPKFIFCDLVLLGENAAKESALSCLDLFLRSEYISDSCQLAVCEGTAEEILTAESAIDDYVSDTIEKLFSNAAVKAGRVCPTTLREFAVDSYGVSKSGRMPFVRASEFEEGEMGTGGQSSGSGSSSGGGEGAPTKKIFTADETALFFDGKMTGLLTADETFAYNLIESNVFAGSITVDTQEGAQSMTILKDEGSSSLEMKGAPTARLRVQLRVDLNNRSNPSDIHEISTSVPSEELQSNAKQLLETQILSLWERTRACNCDLFFLQRQLYRSSLSSYEEWKDTLLKIVTPNVEISIEEAR